MEEVMAAKGESSAEKFSRWGVTAVNVREHLEEIPHVAPDLEDMEGKLLRARELEGLQESLRGQAREITAELRKLASEGEKVRSRMRAHLVAKFGFTSETLVKFGFRPIRIPRRTRVVEVPAPQTPESPQTATPDQKSG
jgi:hypothetical protein